MDSVPIELTRTARLMAGYPHRWFLCGGWAVDAWLGKPTRSHSDVDIAVFHEDQIALYEYLDGWDLIGHDPNVPDDSPDPWNGRHLDLPAHIHANNPALFDGEVEFYLNAVPDDQWACRQRPTVTRRLNGPNLSPWQLPTVPPEIVLFYKAGGDLDAEQLDRLRAHDERDFRVLAPLLTADQHRWLSAALRRVHPNHPWNEYLAQASSS